MKYFKHIVNETLELYIDWVVSDLVILEEREDMFASRKEAAKWIITHSTNPSICFNYLDGKVNSGTVEKYIKSLPVNKIIGWLNENV